MSYWIYGLAIGGAALAGLVVGFIFGSAVEKRVQALDELERVKALKIGTEKASGIEKSGRNEHGVPVVHDLGYRYN